MISALIHRWQQERAYWASLRQAEEERDRILAKARQQYIDLCAPSSREVLGVPRIKRKA